MKDRFLRPDPREQFLEVRMVRVCLAWITEAQHEAGGRARRLPPVDRLVEVSRECPQALGVDSSGYDTRLQRGDFAMNLGRQAQNEPEGVVEAVRVEAGVQSSRAVDETALVVERVCIYLRAFSFQRHAGPPLLPLSYVAWHMKSRAGRLGNKT